MPILNILSSKAPSHVDPPTVKAISTEEIEVQWSAPSQSNGILKPYLVICSDTATYSDTHSATTKDNKTTSVIVEQLRPGREYRCCVVASTYPADRQDAEDCERRSALSNRIRTMALAPSRIPRPKGRAISSTEIQLTWSKPKHPNGILKPYQVTCLDVTHCSAPSRATTRDSETTSVIFGNLIPNTKYQCLIVASTIPAIGQDPLVCERRSELSAPIQTMPSTPSPVQRLRGKAISSTEIEVKWSKPKHPNGILKPYQVACFDTSHGSTPLMTTTTNNETTFVIVGNLIPNREYRCSVVASTIPAVGQDPLECESRSEMSPPIRTKLQRKLSSGVTVANLLCT
ncbi:unnamed protein product [Hydatigera taeniaeformis]|uniref:Fibronectin type-III domain-containing protein n=1 Tax=Hydatigena taeniaeformis TaxID=6205 RepID=A0A0R3WTH7_HYDTA|nr:unnamed protein product [Hydatigera taeniaeformis]